MVYRKLKNGTHAVGFVHGGSFIVYASAFDAREAKALLKAIRAVFDLFYATSGAWVTMGPDGKEIARGGSAKAAKAAGRRRQTGTRAQPARPGGRPS
jgi:predicted HAD superfamily Cof-like phosphohydrolase